MIKVTLSPVDKTDATINFLYALLAERQNEANISHTDMPSRQEHRKFVMRHPYRSWYLIHNEVNKVIGSIYVTYHNEIGIALLNVAQGRGYGSAAIKALCAQEKPLSGIPGERSGTWLANIAPANHRSVKMFEKLGFEKISHTYAFKGDGNDQGAVDSVF